MADEHSARTTPIGVYDRTQPGEDAPSSGEIAAAALCALWVLLAGGYFLVFGTGGADGLRFALVLMTIFLPVAMIWVAATAMRATRILRAESARLQAAVDALRHAYVSQAQAGRSEPQGSAITRKLDEIAAAQRKTETTLAVFTSTRSAPRPATASAAPPATVPAPAEAAAQPTLALGTSAEDTAPALPRADLIRALNFPETAEDTEGFAALRRALKDRQAAQLIQAAQDVLTLLSEDGIYMDDLSPDRARPETWRRFAQGARGREIAALGGIRDRSSLALAAGRMKQDPIFRDAAHHFLRLFDRGVARFEPEATDAEISDLADTRSARAFMLLGRVAGTFD
ncbi:hypothetical protein ROJ8625_03029 [Roseivivax jejudonensis]|uniref:Uncharacterized protein n=1 Tax=Roseivivax jejudonensis TaxID=1529041 RepID=A0A1X6ZSX4_9RHOB|nr:hypothetical protein [Roseivivax jejudonensis]SLN59824.1 hypothetical protein ROJ8625_03029 [Roseivivax jejudonensis]